MKALDIEAAEYLAKPFRVGFSILFDMGREIMTATGTAPMARWRKLMFIYMSRNAWNATSFFKLPPDRVVELGNHVEL